MIFCSIFVVLIKHTQTMYKFVITFAFFIFLTSCNFFKKEPKPLDFTSLDVYPIFEGCDSTATTEKIKQCFEQSFVNFIQRDLDTCHFINQTRLKDTGIIIHFDVLRDGTCKVVEIEKINNIETALPELQSQIIQSVSNLPPFTPAKKIGQKVNARFMIPMYIERNTNIEPVYAPIN